MQNCRITNEYSVNAIASGDIIGTGAMGDTNLKHVSHSYIEGPEATVLNTVDVWLPESNHDGTDSEGKWVMYNASFRVPKTQDAKTR